MVNGTLSTGGAKFHIALEVHMQRYRVLAIEDDPGNKLVLANIFKLSGCIDAIFEENGEKGFKGIDIMRTVRSFDPCLPCGVHMYLGNGRVLERQHAPMFGFGSQGNEGGEK